MKLAPGVFGIALILVSLVITALGISALYIGYTGGNLGNTILYSIGVVMIFQAASVAMCGLIAGKIQNKLALFCVALALLGGSVKLLGGPQVSLVPELIVSAGVLQIVLTAMLMLAPKIVNR